MKRSDHRNKPKGKSGHPPFVPTDEQRHIVAVLSGLRVNWDEIRKLILNPRTGLPIPKSTLNRHFRRELDVGAVALQQLIASKYFAALDAGEAWAVRLGMRNRFGWIFEGSNALPPDVMGAVGSEPEMKISFVLPDKREMRDMAPPIDVAAADRTARLFKASTAEADGEKDRHALRPVAHGQHRQIRNRMDEMSRSGASYPDILISSN